MLIESDKGSSPEHLQGAESAVEAAAARLVTGLPMDQALGLRLMALARAAAAMHAASAPAHDAAAGVDPERTQAAALARAWMEAAA